MKKMFLLIFAISLVLSVSAFPKVSTFAAVSDNAYMESLQRLMDLGVFAKTSTEKMDLNREITREELAAILGRINGKEDQLSLYKNVSSFSDVDKNRWSSPYIQFAVKSGYMTPMPDGKFHPTDKVSFAQAATIFGKLLKYEASTLTGSYPQNYLALIDNLGILDSITYSAYASVTRGQLALMLDRMLTTKVYGSEETFVNTLSNYKLAIVLENSKLNPDWDERKLVTDKGTFYLKDGLTIPEAGKQYLFRVKDNEIQCSALADLDYKELSVRSISNGTIMTNNGEKVVVPAGITYYYKGKATDYDAINPSIQANSSLIIGYDGLNAVYGALFDPLYSKPEVITADKAGTPLEIKYSGKTIEKGGKYVTASQIEVNDVCYEVTDIWGKNGYIIVYDDTVSGIITKIVPNKVSPQYIEIDGTSYLLDESFPKEKLNDSGKNQVGETVKLILGSEGTVVDLISETITGTNKFALVLNAYTENSVNSADFGTPYYYVTLLHSDGGKKTYRADRSMLAYRGKLVTYEITSTGTEYDTVSLTSIDSDVTGSFKVNKEERMIGDSYVANGAVLFNIVNTSSPEIQASVISFSDLPSGYLTNGKVKYIHKSGDFMDIDVMLLNNALDENVAYGLVTGKNSVGNMVGTEFIINETVNFLVNGQNMTYQGNDTGLYIGSVAKVTLNGNSINSVEYAITAETYSKEIQAVDSSRIKINGRVYTFHKNLSIYKLKSDSSWKKLDVSDLTKGTDYSVTLYLDRPLSYGGKVVMILLR